MDKEPIQRIERISAINRFTDTKSVVTKGKVGHRLEIDGPINLNHHWANRQAGKRHLRAQTQP